MARNYGRKSTSMSIDLLRPLPIKSVNLSQFQMTVPRSGVEVEGRSPDLSHIALQFDFFFRFSGLGKLRMRTLRRSSVNYRIGWRLARLRKKWVHSTKRRAWV